MSETSENGEETSFLLKHVQVKVVQILHERLNKHDMHTSLKKKLRQLLNITHFCSLYLPLVFYSYEYKVPSQKLQDSCLVQTLAVEKKQTVSPHVWRFKLKQMFNNICSSRAFIMSHSLHDPCCAWQCPAILPKKNPKNVRFLISDVVSLQLTGTLQSPPKAC